MKFIFGSLASRNQTFNFFTALPLTRSSQFIISGVPPLTVGNGEADSSSRWLSTRAFRELLCLHRIEQFDHIHAQGIRHSGEDQNSRILHTALDAANITTVESAELDLRHRYNDARLACSLLAGGLTIFLLNILWISLISHSLHIFALRRDSNV